jgi:hypothetical protein
VPAWQQKLHLTDPTQVFGIAHLNATFVPLAQCTFVQPEAQELLGSEDTSIALERVNLSRNRSATASLPVALALRIWFSISSQ